jgi:hypothetical protein
MTLIRLRKKRGKIKVKSRGSNKIFLDPETRVNIYKIYLETLEKWSQNLRSELWE